MYYFSWSLFLCVLFLADMHFQEISKKRGWPIPRVLYHFSSFWKENSFKRGLWSWSGTVALLILVEKYETANWSSRQGDEELNKRIKQKKYVFKQIANLGQFVWLYLLYKLQCFTRISTTEKCGIWTHVNIRYFYMWRYRQFYWHQVSLLNCT